MAMRSRSSGFSFVASGLLSVAGGFESTAFESSGVGVAGVLGAFSTDVGGSSAGFGAGGSITTAGFTGTGGEVVTVAVVRLQPQTRERKKRTTKHTKKNSENL